jgi:hypothetical protein
MPLKALAQYSERGLGEGLPPSRLLQFVGAGRGFFEGPQCRTPQGKVHIALDPQRIQGLKSQSVISRCQRPGATSLMDGSNAQNGQNMRLFLSMFGNRYMPDQPFAGAT